MITFFSKEHRHPQKVSRRNVKGFGLFSSSARFDPENQFLGNIYSFNDYYCEPGYGIPMHPHEFFEVVCLQISGCMHFRDELGNDKLTTRGSMHRFSSSTGYLHETTAVGEGAMRFISIWLRPYRLPQKPSYQQHSFGEQMFPLNRLQKLLASDKTPKEHSAPLVAPVDVEIFGGCADAFGFSEKVTVNETALLYVVEGNLLIDDIVLEEGDHLRIDNNAAFSVAGNPVGRFVLVYTRSD